MRTRDDFTIASAPVKEAASQLVDYHVFTTHDGARNARKERLFGRFINCRPGRSQPGSDRGMTGRVRLEYDQGDGSTRHDLMTPYPRQQIAAGKITC